MTFLSTEKILPSQRGQRSDTGYLKNRRPSGRRFFKSFSTRTDIDTAVGIADTDMVAATANSCTRIG